MYNTYFVLVKVMGNALDLSVFRLLLNIKSCAAKCKLHTLCQYLKGLFNLSVLIQAFLLAKFFGNLLYTIHNKKESN